MIKCNTYNAYPLTNYRIYRFGRLFKKDIDLKRKLRRLKFRYYSNGITISKDYVLLTLYNSYHHIILIKLDFDKYSMLNDVTLGNCQNIKDALSDLLHSRKIRLFTKKNLKKNSRVIGVFWRSGFEKKYYPYKLPHINYYKEKKTIHLTFLNEKIIFAVFKLIIVSKKHEHNCRSIG
mmetsp:Transcript_4926/g.9005  ORF Transcript_4926/g.9005 Transcript_4926/m.9005 type:complete len:177 (+) Transcript_4926:1381-1911(+)